MLYIYVLKFILTFIFSFLGFISTGYAIPSKEKSCEPLFYNNINTRGQNIDRISGQTSKRPLGPIFNIFPTLTYGGLQGVLVTLSEIKLASDGILLGPIYEQTLQHMPDGKGGITNNVTGYWPKNHMKIDERLGGESSFIQTVNYAKKLRFKEIWVDMVYGHLGYTWKDILRFAENTKASYIKFDPDRKNVRLHHLEIPTPSSDEVYFNHESTTLENLILSGYVRPLDTRDVSHHHWEELESIRDPQSDRIYHLWNELSQLSLHGLHGFNHSNPKVLEYLTESFLKYAEAGVTGFRMDAALYVKPEATAEIINRVHKSYPHVKFLLELLVGREAVLHRMMKEIEQRVQIPENIFYIDFPQMYEVRRIQDQKDFQFNWYFGFIRHQNRLQMKREKLVPSIINHDFGNPLEDTHINSVIHALTEFTHRNPTLNYPHTDIKNGNNNRHHIEDYVYQRDNTGKLIRIFSNALAPYRKNAEFFHNPMIWTGEQWIALNSLPAHFFSDQLHTQGSYVRDSLFLKLELPDREIVLFIKKDSLQSKYKVPVSNKEWSHSLLHYSDNNPQVSIQHLKSKPVEASIILEIEAFGPTVALIELKK
ncbi:MAG TPA: alpha-amylase family glycosyl hydrolase [Pseudobdellovibrionaceae bacterium]|nr:alpha-amylase family glycosyl hydrolase [Pseudobdellovibrionaceae bacterium]